eukprot:Gb_30933 [translate_table: standard]
MLLLRQNVCLLSIGRLMTRSGAGGYVGANGRLQGRLEVSRAFGDRQFKKQLVFCLHISEVTSHFRDGSCLINLDFKYLVHWPTRVKRGRSGARKGTLSTSFFELNRGASTLDAESGTEADRQMTDPGPIAINDQIAEGDHWTDSG